MRLAGARDARPPLRLLTPRRAAAMVARVERANRALLTAAVLLATALPSPAEARPGASRLPARPLESAAPLINIAKTADLAFGQVVAGSTLGTVVVTPAGARSSTGGTTLGSSSGAGPATFNVTALALTAYSIVLPASATLSTFGITR